MEKEMMWNQDGHVIELLLDRSNVVIVRSVCPEGDAKCRNSKGVCLFRLFVDIYGLDCNVGISPVSSKMEFAWAFIGDESNPLDAGQLWIIPVDDEIFSAWAAAQS